MTYEEALDKAIKFLKLAKSDNPNEAALAAARAQEIIDRYKLDVSAAETSGEGADRPQEAITKFADPIYGDVFGKNPTWKLRLTSALCAVNACRCYFQGGATFLIGRPSDASAVRYLFAFLVREVDRLTERDAKGNGRTWVNNYRLGVVETISKRLKEQRKATQDAVKREAEEQQAKLFAQVGEAAFQGTTALVRVNQAIARVEAEQAEVIDWEKKNMKYGRSRRSNFTTDYGAREAGRRAGHEVRLSSARGSLKG